MLGLHDPSKIREYSPLRKKISGKKYFEKILKIQHFFLMKVVLERLRSILLSVG